MDIFEKASRQKVRFQLDGVITNINTEDLWHINLDGNSKVTLNKLAKQVSRELRESSEEDFVKESTSKNSSLELKLDLLKHVIDVRKAEQKAREEAAEKKAQRQEILSIIQDKKKQALRDMPVEDLEKLL